MLILSPDATSELYTNTRPTWPVNHTEPRLLPNAVFAWEGQTTLLVPVVDCCIPLNQFVQPLALLVTS